MNKRERYYGIVAEIIDEFINLPHNWHYEYTDNEIDYQINVTFYEDGEFRVKIFLFIEEGIIGLVNRIRSAIKSSKNLNNFIWAMERDND